MPNCSICKEKMAKNLMVAECGHVFHEHCICCWSKISVTCPVCKQEVDYTKLYFDLEDENELEEKIESLNKTLCEYKKLAVAQSKSIATKSYKIWETEIKIKELTETNIKLKDTIKQLEKVMHPLPTPPQHSNVFHMGNIGTNICLFPVHECICLHSNESVNCKA
eukprot:120859_1